MEKKIIGYRLLKDTPDSKAGDIFTSSLMTSGYYQRTMSDGKKCNYHKDVVEHQPDWFEPVNDFEPYKPALDKIDNILMTVPSLMECLKQQHNYAIGIGLATAGQYLSYMNTKYATLVNAFERLKV